MKTEILYWFLYIAEGIAIAYFLLIASYTIGWLRLKKSVLSHQVHQLKISVLVAFRNEEANILPLIQSLNAQNYPKHLLQIILADDHSEDETSVRIHNAISSFPELNLNYLAVIGSGKKAALSEALKLAEGELIVVTDADCSHGKYWLSQFASCYESNDYKLLLGPVLLDPAKTFFEKMQSLEFISLIASTAGAASIGFPAMGNGANLAFSREAALAVGGYKNDSSLASGDDVFLMFAIIKKYGRKAVHFVFSKDAIVTTAPSPDLASFVAQRMRWVSKSRAYRNIGIILPAIIVFLMNILIIGFLFATVFYPYMFFFYLLYVVLKYLIDYPLLLASTVFMNRRKLLWLTIPMAFVYPFYVVGIGIAGNLITVSWKGRKI